MTIPAGGMIIWTSLEFGDQHSTSQQCKMQPNYHIIGLYSEIFERNNEPQHIFDSTTKIRWRIVALIWRVFPGLGPRLNFRRIAKLIWKFFCGLEPRLLFPGRQMWRFLGLDRTHGNIQYTRGITKVLHFILKGAFVIHIIILPTRSANWCPHQCGR